MANNVFANGREISCKKADGKTVCAFPDVCMTPPTSPATPAGVPISYPNTGMAKDTTNGSRTVKISGQEIIKKNVSYYKTSYGDEAGCATPAKKGIITGTIKGKVYFTSWSMDVKAEGKNVVRHVDTTTHNHGSNPNEVVPWPYIDSMSIAPDSSCKKDKKKIEQDCKKNSKNGKAEQCPGSLSSTVSEQRGGFKKGRTIQAANKATEDAEGSDCVKAMRCFLRPHSRDLKGKLGCCPGQSPHHIPPDKMVKHLPKHTYGSALCVCLEGASQHVGSHGENHAALDHLASKKGWGKCTVKEYNEICAIAVAAQCGCSKECIEQQLNESPAFKDALDEEVEHWQSNSKQLSATLKKKLNKAFEAAQKASRRK